jgi:hypothetical protein
VVAAAIALALPYDPHRLSPSWRLVAGVSAYAVGFAVALEALQRWVVRRPQPFGDPSVIAADDAIRSQSLHSIAGAGVAVLLLLAAGLSLLLAASDVAVLRLTMWAPAAVGALGALVACSTLSERSWRVRRRVGPIAGPAA